MPFFVAGLCFLALWIFGKICDKEKPWQKMRREAWQNYNAGKISSEEYFRRSNESFRLQHGIKENKKE
jgi:hypothetical protein